KDNGTKGISFGCSPVGFDSVEGFYRNITEKTGGEFSLVMERLSRMKDRAYRCVIASSMDLRGRTFCVSAPPSIKDPLSKFLEESFGMLHAEERYEYLFAEGNRCVMEKASGRCPRCIDIGFPSNKVDFNRNPVLGMYGTMYLLDSLFL
ncbi:MAG: nitrogenase component 1, partial [archaeon]|nr:nitrogenase component 1 [archaeon]